MPLFRLDPEMDRWRDDMMRMWNRMTHEFSQVMAHQPSHYVSEGTDSVVVEVELPGVDPSGVDVEADTECLTVRGTWPAAPLGLESHRRTGPFQVTINLPQDVDPNGANAQFRHGLLTVELPKASGPRRRLDVRVHSGTGTTPS